jgi:hypothetical protein
LEKFEVQTVVVLILWIDIEAIHTDGTWEVMVHDSAIDDSIAKIFNFHFGAGLRYDLFDPVEDGGLAGHGAGCSGFLHHGEDENEVFGLIIIYRMKFNCHLYKLRLSCYFKY